MDDLARYNQLQREVLVMWTSPIALMWRNPRTVQLAIARREAEMAALRVSLMALGRFF